MIPFAILSCEIQQRGQRNQEVRILDLSEEGFTFRLAEELVEKNAGDREFLLHFFRFQESEYRGIILKEYTLEIEEKTEFYTVYRLTTEDFKYRQSAKRLMKEYLRYISLKLEGDDALLSKELTGYPAEQEKLYAESFQKQKEMWLGGLRGAAFPKELKGCALAVSVDNPVKYERYLTYSLSEFVSEYWEKNRLTGHPLAGKKVDCLYIGNQFCHLLFPEEIQLLSMLEKAVKEQVQPIVVFTYMQESEIASMEKLLEHLAQWCGKYQQRLELVVNDWGMLSLLREKKDSGNAYECFTLTLGVLLQKQRKDVRMPYKKGFDKYKHLFGKASVHAPFYQEYLREHFGITRISYEACGYPVEIAPGKASLHLPFYQMNTSQHCTLYARCHNGDRSRQTAVKNCPGYCTKQVFLYPEMLHMVGRYNSLFGYDTEILRDGSILSNYLKQGVDRVVMELL